MEHIKIRILGLLLVFGLLGCDSFVDVDTPNSQLTGDAVFEDRATANAALLNVYSTLRDSGLFSGNANGAGVCLGMYADELVYYGTTNDNTSFIFNNTLLANTGIVSQLWNESYHTIYCANAVVAGCRNSAALTTTDKDTFVGEALFVRALVHFYLTNVYGAVPYVTTTDYTVNRLVARTPTAVVLQLVVADLEEAISLLPEAYSTSDRVRPNRAVAMALLARVYLYQGNWAQAANASSAVLNNGDYVWETDIDKIFLKDCSATIWQFAPRLEGDNTEEASVYTFQTGPPPFVGLRPTLYNSFAAGDLRKSHWITAVSNGMSTWYHASKYKQNNNTGSSVEYSIVFRMAELYLIRAEARARQGELSSALDDLNVIRSLAGLPPSTETTMDGIVAAVLEERQHEFFTEYGHRFFDLKRYGALDVILPATKAGWNTSDRDWPIPERDVLSNPNLTQNPGY